jgi:hypothetical protein
VEISNALRSKGVEVLPRQVQKFIDGKHSTMHLLMWLSTEHLYCIGPAFEGTEAKPW